MRGKLEYKLRSEGGNTVNYFRLAMTTKEVLEKIEQAGKEGRYSEHIDPIDYNNCNPVDGTFPYIPTGHLRRKQWIENRLIIRPFSYLVNRFLLKTKVYGRENIKGIHGAIITCNHVNKLDTLVVKHALKGHDVKVMVGDFNNQKGRLGDFMRAAGSLPFSMDHKARKNFNDALTYYLNNGVDILFFPEVSEWWCYEQPRPYWNGAYHYAVNNHVPVIPTFITFTKTGIFDSNGIERRKFHIHILDPIYPKANVASRENIQWMKEKNYDLCKRKYEDFYEKRMPDSCVSVTNN